MNKILTISIGAIVVIVIVALVVFKLLLSPNAPAPTNININNSNGSPTNTTQVSSSGQSSANTFSVSTIGGGTLQTKDFKDDPASGQYPTPGYYYLGFHTAVQGTSTANATATANPPYSILYTDANQYFTIELLQEPVATARQQAEQYLMDHLGISQDQMCQLKYMVSVPQSVNSFYAGQNLGFSFCPGAVQL